jgi:hypothetical protein
MKKLEAGMGERNLHLFRALIPGAPGSSTFDIRIPFEDSSFVIRIFFSPFVPQFTRRGGCLYRFPVTFQSPITSLASPATFH